MTQFVFVHGPGAGGCADSFVHQLNHFPGSLAPNLPGHLEGESLADVKSYTEWLRQWLQSQGADQELVLVGFTLGACIGLQYALDYPDEVKALVLMTVAMGPKQRAPGSLEFRLKAAEEPETYQKWLDAMDHAMMFIEPGLRARLLECHRQVGPLSQHQDLVVIDRFDVVDRIHTLKAPLLLIRGLDDPGHPPEYELDIHQAVPGSQYVKLKQAGHFPMVEQPEVVNRAIEEFLASTS
ncbi:MAG: alpha/beta fold hydrolase [Dehalococcoidia bacterium]